MRLRPVLIPSFHQLGCVSALSISLLASGLTGCAGASAGSTLPVQLAAVTAPSGSMLPVTVTATSNAGGSVVTFGVAGTATGSFSPATCTIANGSCSVSYMPTGSLAAGTYPADLTASFTAAGKYVAENATSTLTINANPTYALSLLTSFTGMTGAAQGADPNYGNLIQGKDGAFYGVTSAGAFLSPRGTSGSGTAFKVTASGSFTLLHAFAGTAGDGAAPAGSLVQGSDGNFYGVTARGGSANLGTVYKITQSGSVTLLHTFTDGPADGANPNASLIQGSDGNFYGTTTFGGASGAGTVFKITPSGSFSLVYSFNFATDGGNTSGSLVEGSDGNFYGIAGFGGAGGWGTVYVVTPSGSFTLLHTFFRVPGDGTTAFGNLVQGSDGKFYGMTYEGGSASGEDGTVFTITASGTFTLLHSFAAGLSDGEGPYGSLVQGSDGNFYGMTNFGGAQNGKYSTGFGTVFQMTPSGSVTLLHSFPQGSTTDGQQPNGNLIQGGDGNFYGMTSRGGASADGTIFKLAVSPAFAGPVSLSVPVSVTRGTAFTLGYANINAGNTAGVPALGKATQQQCVAATYLASDTTYTPVDTTGWVGAKTAATTVTNVPLTAPAAPGTYTYGLTCGGGQSGFATLVVQ